MDQALQQAMTHIENGEVEKGLEELAALESKVDDQGKYDIAVAYQELGLADRAFPLIEDLISHYPDEGELQAMAAELAIDLDKEDEAMEWLLEVNENDEAFARSQLLLADLYQLQGLDEAAEQRLKKALEKHPDEPVLLAALGDYYLDRGDFAKSIPFLKQAQQKEFEFPEGSLALRLAEAYSATGQFEEAISHYRQGLKEKTEIHSLFGYAYTLLQVEDYEKAAEKLEELKELDAGYVSLYPYLAKAYEGMEKLTDALQAADEGLKQDEYNDELYLKAGKILLRLGNRDEGIKRLRESLSMNPSNVQAAQMLLNVWKEEEQYEDMLELILHLQELGESDPLFEWYKGVSYHDLEQWEDAIKAFESAAPHFKTDADFQEDFGRFMLELGKPERALFAFERALKEDPNNMELQQFVFDLQERFDS